MRIVLPNEKANELITYLNFKEVPLEHPDEETDNTYICIDFSEETYSKAPSLNCSTQWDEDTMKLLMK